jgi:hypothetical protein
MAKVLLMYFDPISGDVFCNGFSDSAENMFRIAFGVKPETLDQTVLAEINITGTLYYSRRNDIPNGVEYQSTLELLKDELKK